MEQFAERIVHVDMDAFFVEVERQRRPELVGRPVLVGGTGDRAVVASASYEARARGARSAMPMGHARRLVPGATIVPPDHAAYRRASAAVFDVIGGFTPRHEAVSIDEAFLDIGGLRLHHPDPEACGRALQAAIRQSTGLPSSVGIATSKLLAKMASRDAKPNGLLLVRAGTELTFLHAKPVRELWGVGEATHARLEELGIETVGDLASYPRETLVRRLGESLGGALWDLAQGRDPRPVGSEDPARSISVEETFEIDLKEMRAMERALLGQSDRLANRMRRAEVVAHTVTLKVRYPDFATVTRAHTFSEPIGTSAELYEMARRLLGDTAAIERGARLLGVGAEGLVPASDPRQLGLEPEPWEGVDRAVAEVRDRFGPRSVGRASLADDRDPSPPDPPVP